MKKLTDLDLEKIYCGWLGKNIGIRYGAPVEMWDAEQIRTTFGTKEGYLADYNDFAADDDSNGPVFFYRALRDCADPSAFCMKDVSDAWLNFVPFEHGFYWWGGYGVSEEHTAYLNLEHGISAPQSGSIAQNGAILAEQIGGQIFSDVWGLVAPHDIFLAARLAETAARVSHDGAAVDGGRFVAAMISAAFYAPSVQKIIEEALRVIPEEGEYAKMVRDIVAFHDGGEDAEACFSYIRRRYWKDRYGGNCHIIPNAALMVCALLYGEGDFVGTLRLVTFFGFDTDCNAGNLGTVLGVFTQLKGVDYDVWIAPLHDTAICSSVLGYENIVPAPAFAYDVFRTALRLRGEEYEGKYAAALLRDEKTFTYDFLLPGSTSGMRAADGARICNRAGALEIAPPPAGHGRVFVKTYYGKADFSDNRYDPATSPKAYRGQTLCADYEADEGAEVRLYYQNLRNGKCYLSEAGAREVRMTCEEDALIGRVGLLLSGGTVRLKSLSVSGKADYVLDFSKAWEEDYCLEHVEVEQCTYYRGNWRLEEGQLTGRCLADGQLFTGKPLGDVLFETAITPVAGSAFGVIFKAHGVRRQYRLQFARDKLAFVRLSDGERTLLTECAFPLTAGEHYRVQLVVVGKTMRAYVNGVERLAYTDEALPAFGYAGAAVSDGTAARFDRFVLKEL